MRSLGVIEFAAHLRFLQAGPFDVEAIGPLRRPPLWAFWRWPKWFKALRVMREATEQTLIEQWMEATIYAEAD